ncbi:divergent polysaccharide deacetylase family protein [Ovoidimarina sediminis]|uniref:divergent polysaccharide deacetylase family protein n=1 Tax=Ovoidimarina sediminis TaxID=3079856 RepID=UPI0029133837|nr:divergent polysaccharide deacetylase family protein [Rhodophyticola sp. MJ-SS7]MDU8942175.1 divergent polysaccharide deacetylase family protein [Rhodophyticola sp. MJ-SS7]
MLRGIFAGGFWGGLIGIITVALTSQLADWRDLTPAVTEAETEQDIRPEEPAEAAQEPPVVIAGTVTDKPADTSAPASATDQAQEISAPSLETSPPSQPAASDAPAMVTAPAEPSLVPGTVAETEAGSPAGVSISQTVAPAADTPPSMISTDTALTPARLAPSAQSETLMLGPPAEEGMAPEAPLKMAALDLAPAPNSALAPPTGPGAGVEAPEIPDRPVPPAPEVSTAEPVLPDAEPAPVVPAEMYADPRAVADEPELLPTEEPARAPEEELPPVAETAPAAQPETIPEAPEPVVVIEAPEPVQVVEAEKTERVEDAPTDVAQANPESSGEVRILRLPTIGDGAEGDAGDEAEDPGAEENLQSAQEGIGGALTRNAIDFEVPQGAARIAIVLVHSPDAPAAEELPVPLTFAVPSGMPDAADVVSSYKAAGHEVIVVPDLPDRPTPQDVEVAVSAAEQILAGAVAMGDVSGAGFQGVRGAAGQAVSAAGRSGHGLVTAGRGFNSVERLAAEAGVAAFALTTTVSEQVTDPRAMARALDQAAFRARRDGAAGFLGHASGAQIAAILSWIADVDDDLAAVPISTVLKGQ